MRGGFRSGGKVGGSRGARKSTLWAEVYRARLLGERRARLSGTSSTALARIAVAVVVERRRAKSPWLDFIWRPTAVLAGTPEAAPWTPLGDAEDTTLFYACDAVIELYRTEPANYRSNLASSAPSLWVITRPDASRKAYRLL